jgi:hypothetical protein
MFFDLYKNKVRLKKDSIEVQEVKDMIEGLTDEQALSATLYLFLTTDRTEENPLSDLPEEEKDAEAARVVFGKDTPDLSFVDDDVYAAAVAAYNAWRHDSFQDDINVYDKKLFQFITMLEETSPEIIKNTHDITGKVSFSTNIDIITTILNNTLNIIIDKGILLDMKNSGKYNKGLRGTLSNRKQSSLLNKINKDK